MLSSNMGEGAIDDSLERRLSGIQTHWTLMAQAHGPEDEPARRLRGALLERYARPAFRYLLAATRDLDLAEELCQEFAVRFTQGDFRGADPRKGRFRDYLKRALANLLRDHYRRRENQPAPLPEDAAEPVEAAYESGPDFAASWREELIAQVWETLAQHNANYFAVLLCRVQHPDLSSRELAKTVSQQLGRDRSADWVRQTQQRAQKKFADLLLKEVRESLPNPTQAAIEQELRELDLLRYCRSALQRLGEQI